MARISIVILLSLFVAAGGQAQTEAARTPGAAAAAPPGRPDSATPPQATAVLRGHVTAADTGRPMAKAQVRIVAREIGENLLAATDGSGRFEFTSLRAGRYTVSASKGGYVALSYGQQRPLDAGRPVEVLENQVVERIDLALPRGGVLTGRVLDEFGEPVSDVVVSAMRAQFVQGQRRLLATAAPSPTNDIGEFRIFGLPAGQYFVLATWRPSSPAGATNARTAYAPVYFPGTTEVADARRVTVDVGQQVDGITLALTPVAATRITGT